MKKYITLFLIVYGSVVIAQPNYQTKCQNIYVWDFSDQTGQHNRTTNDLTNAVEEVLINADGCFVLERRKLATLLSHFQSEKGGQYSIKDLRTEVTGTLSG